MNKKHRVIAINLPQFHPFKENNEWWGEGFTEWTNVVKARPRFKGHYQPHLPSNTGFYDLRLPEARQMQADMARKYGIYGFCYYHYWFNGKQLMERPVNDILKSGEPDFPFMLCWANENWTKAWDGLNKNILIQQNYSHEDDIEHMRWLCKNVFSDKRYIRVDDKPVFAVYRIELFPDFSNTVKTWRKVAKEEFGMDLYLINAQFAASPKGEKVLSDNGLDASYDFQPFDWEKVYDIPRYRYMKSILWRIPWLNKQPFYKKKLNRLPLVGSYPEYVEEMKKQPMPSYKVFPCVCPSWDNSPRRVGKYFYALANSTPTFFGEWLSDTLKRFVPFSKEENFVFINAWNEWAEGNHLEPDQKWGTAYLEEVKKAIDND